MKQQSDLDQNNQPVIHNYYYAPVTIIQANNHSSISMDKPKKNKLTIWDKIVKAIPLLGAIIAWFKDAG